MFDLNFLIWLVKFGLIISNSLVKEKLKESCAGRCGASLDSSKSCQCNTACVNFGDCCPDYDALCGSGSSNPGGTCDSIASVSEKLWASDSNKFQSSEYSVNYQTQVSDGTNTDASSQKLFTSVNEGRFSSATYSTFLALLDNFDPDKGDRETPTSGELAEESAFLDAILGTSVMNTLLDYLKCRGIVSDQAGLRAKLQQVWFDLYPRSGSSSIPDTSGFEHVMVGEYKSTTEVNGFHNWISFYENEKDGSLNYYGYVTQDNPGLIGAAFNWDGRQKALGSFFIGVSPEFDMAVYTLCFLTNPGKACNIMLGGYPITIMSYNKDGHLATAYAAA